MAAIIEKIYNHQNSDSLASKLRQKRLTLFKSLINSVPSPIKLLDVGGEGSFWKNTGFLDEVDKDIEITIANIYPSDDLISPNIKEVFGDARNMEQFQDKEFDVVFSNSVIEHVGNYEQQQQMASEVLRVGKKYFVQTPNFYFPIEPHFLFPFFQFLPVSLRVLLLKNFDLGWIKKIPDEQECQEMVTGIQLLDKKRFVSLFPNANIYEEKFLGLTKSFIAYEGWNN